MLFIDTIAFAFDIELKGFKQRGIEKPSNEIVVKGPHESFVENIRVNKIILEKYDSNVLVNSIINQWNIMSIKKKRIYMIRHIRFSLIFEFIYRIIYTIKLFTEDMYYTILGNVNIDSNIKE